MFYIISVKKQLQFERPNQVLTQKNQEPAHPEVAPNPYHTILTVRIPHLNLAWILLKLLLED